MAKKFLLFLFFVSILSFGIIQNSSKKKTSSLPLQKVESVAISPSKVIESRSIFVSYWNIPLNRSEISQYDRLIYFGIQPSLLGYDQNEAGYKNLEKFTANNFTGKKLLTIRMVNPDEAVAILKNQAIWRKIISETFEIAKRYEFEGIVLDLEVGGMLFDEISPKINEFTHKFYTEAKFNQIHFAFALYGDVLYRKRPYEIEFIAKNSDEIMIMAYDYSKPRGEPGPNFPLRGREKYGYDYEKLLKDLSVIPKEKLSFIFGMYGYDWAVDEKKRPIRPAKSLSLGDIKKNFIDQCLWKNCVTLRDSLSAETEIDYVDEDLQYHIVWFENEQSTEEKIRFLKEKGIGNFIYWVYGYF